MEKFTKGDWKVLPIEEDKEYIRIRGTRLGENYKIANVLDLKLHHKEGQVWCERDRVESLANAHLIKTAPKLYGMLSMVLNEMEYLISELNKQKDRSVTSYSETPPDYHDQETLHQIACVLAEARGESGDGCK